MSLALAAEPDLVGLEKRLTDAALGKVQLSDADWTEIEDQIKTAQKDIEDQPESDTKRQALEEIQGLLDNMGSLRKTSKSPFTETIPDTETPTESEPTSHATGSDSMSTGEESSPLPSIGTEEVGSPPVIASVPQPEQPVVSFPTSTALPMDSKPLTGAAFTSDFFAQPRPNPPPAEKRIGAVSRPVNAESPTLAQKLPPLDESALKGPFSTPPLIAQKSAPNVSPPLSGPTSTPALIPQKTPSAQSAPPPITLILPEAVEITESPKPASYAFSSGYRVPRDLLTNDWQGEILPPAPTTPTSDLGQFLTETLSAR